MRGSGFFMNETIIYNCRKLVSLWDTMDELYSMRIHNEENIDAFNKEIKYLCNSLLTELKEREVEFK